LVLEFADFELDDTAYELRRGRETVKLEPKVFDVLRHMIAHRERVVPKTEFLEVLWPGEYVTESALPRAVAAARKALGDDRERQRFIRTVHGRGYQFVAPVNEREARRAAHRPRADAGPRPLPPRDAAAAVFVGRETVLERLESALEDAAAGRGRLVLLFGEPGIGKTRTAQELAERARARGFEAVVGRCYQGEGAPAFWPWVQILRACTEDVHDDELAGVIGPSGDALAHLVPALAARLPAPLPPLPASPDEARFRLFEGVSGFLARRSGTRPLLLLLDDLHWADKPTALLLRFLAGQLPGLRILVVGAYREVELRRGSPLSDVLGDLTREPHAERVPLRGLDREAVARFIEAATGAPCDEALASAVAEVSLGNPFFLNETVRLLSAEGPLDAHASRRAWDASLPQGLRDVVGRRLDRLSEECNRVLTLASVVGIEFGFNVLERLADTGADRLLEILEEAVRSRVIAESHESLGRYAFSHALIRQSIYEELSTPLRVRLHRQLGEVLEEIYRDAPEAHLDALSHHFFQAAPGGDVDKAIDYAMRAGRSALALLAYEEAAQQFARALQALDLRVPDDETRRCELLLALADAWDKAGERGRMREVYSEAAERARRLQRPDLLALAALGFAGRTERATPDTGMRALLEEALDALGESEPGLRARILGYLVGTPPYNLCVEQRDAMSQRALALARASGDPLALETALAARGFAMLGPDHVDERLSVATELLELASRSDHPEMQISALETLIRSHLLLGDIREAERAIARYQRIADALRQPVYRFLSSFYRVARALSTGRLDDAEAHIREGFELGSAAQHPATGPIFWGQWLWLAQERGDADGFERANEAIVGALGTEWVSGSMSTILDSLVPHAALLRGRRDEARRLLRGLPIEGLAALPRDEHWLTAMSSFAELIAALEEREHAQVLYGLLLPYARLNAVHDLLRTDRGAVAHYLGVLAAVLDRPEEAAVHFESALEMNARMGARAYLARSGAEYAALLLRRGGAGDRARARELRDAAQRSADELGLHGLSRRLAAPSPESTGG
jgi:DNA-binding winged helix-turn-helix (wHTH) protein/tetratricopeptide (TPR) repeat protein